MNRLKPIEYGAKTEPWRVEEIRNMRLNGCSLHAIATQMNVSWTTVSRYCKDLPEPAYGKMSDQERQGLLTRWKPVGDFFNGWPEDGEPGSTQGG